LNDPTSLLIREFGNAPGVSIVSVPGRVNLIGEHIDYHSLPVLPIAIERRVRIAFRPRLDRRVRAVSAGGYGETSFEWTGTLKPDGSGDWGNYIKAAAQAIDGKWEARLGIDAAVESDLPPAAGLSSSSALMVGFTLALLQANGIHATFEELMEVLPEGEHFVGTRGGGMDHAAVLAGESGCALLIHFAPLAVRPVRIPRDWAFLVAHSLTMAEKSGEVREKYNARRAEGLLAIERLGFKSYREAVEGCGRDELESMAANRLQGAEQKRFLHVTREAARVGEAVSALESADATAFGRLLTASHESLRDLLEVSCPALDELVELAQRSGALGARVTGAGFGGCVVIACLRGDLERIEHSLVQDYYSKRTGFDRSVHLIRAEPSAGALNA
jgi:galactokinase